MAFVSWFDFLSMYGDMEALDALLELHSPHDVRRYFSAHMTFKLTSGSNIHLPQST